MITVEEHRAAVLAAVAPLEPRQVPLTEALDCVLAEDVVATLAVPPFDNSAMDGYAVRTEDVATAAGTTPVRLHVVADLPAGSGERPEVLPGTAVRIMTGAPMPPGADTIVPVEQTDQHVGPGAGSALPEVVEIRASAAVGAHLRRAGEDVSVGAPVLPAGVELGARELSTAASTGHGTLPVRPRVRLGVLSTGSELVAPGTALEHGQIPDSNSTLVAGLAATSGARPVPLGSVVDDAGALRARLRDSLPDVDAIVTTGGVSAGAYDVVKEVLAPLGEVTFSAVAMQPGKPQGFGVLRDGGRAVPIFCLPGNPVSVFVSYLAFVEPALRVMSGQGTTDEPETLRPPLLEAVVEVGWTCPPGRRQYMPVVLEESEDDAGTRVLLAHPAAAGGSGSHLVASLARAHALAIVEADVESVAVGDVVTVMMVP
ncbi:molybdopterin molybdotransferase MoeA [Georgenia subflava]|uniref:Molybdopterin molybdenumtransferase n=1 Tax=Georgenia subflava TaxID=1622177 RepID=A0A6N7EIU9_9MICO|nr:gephyrin-like molybdotransferase Glp [Georgenia subflava]MPV37003.1 molybdopterin molybdenumtransferase MoeA [Georgenia subflava]